MVGSSPFISLINYCLILRPKIISGTYGGLTYVKQSQRYPAHRASILQSFPRRLPGIINDQRRPCALI